MTSTAHRRTWSIVALSGGMAALAAILLVPLASEPPPLDGRPFHPLVLAALFAAAEICVFHVHVRRHAHSFSLMEAPLVLGAVFFGPLTVVSARLLGSAGALVVARRQAPLKVLFNLCLFAMETGIVVAVVHIADLSPLEPSGWFVLLVSSLTALAVGSTAISMAIALSERIRLVPRAILDVVGAFGPLTTTIATVCGVLATLVLQVASQAWVLLAAACGIIGIGLRAHADLRERHQRLERAYAFTTDAVASIEVGEDRSRLLDRACELLRAEWAVLAVVDADGSLVVTNKDGELAVTSGAHAEAITDRRRRQLGNATATIVVGADADLDGFERAVVAELPGTSGSFGTFLVADRIGAVDRFGDSDRRLLDTLSVQAAVVLRNRALLDRLRQEAADREHRALHDALTLLPNRVHFDASLQQALAARLPGANVAVLLVDLDRFKEVNDTLGHQQGDRLLQDVAARIRDAVSDDGLVSRLGGDEFAILLRDRDVDGVQAAAHDLLDALAAPFPLAELLVDVGASIGIALCPMHAEDATTLLQRADVAMYAAKARGSGVAVYDHADDRTSRERLGLVAELRNAIERGELRVEFQPIIDLATTRPVGAEALCRWQHPTRGLVSPDEFVPLAEASGLIRPLTEFVLRSALTHLRSWREAGADVGVSVNLSARNLLDESLPDTVATALAATGVPPSAVTLEVTETSIMSEPIRSIGIVNRLSTMGVRLSIDDFGTGYSSLSQLHRLPVDEVKVDRSFVQDLAHKREDVAIVKAIIDLGHSLDLEVTAEGIEDSRTMQLLAGLGCTNGQGYHVSRPLSPAVFARWLRSHRRESADIEVLFAEPPPPAPASQLQL
jgi:diguanylate cyclase (GGDEF)-like protein